MKVQLPFRLLKLCLIRPGIELKEDLPFLDKASFLEVDLVQVAPHVRPHLHEIHGGDPGREVRVVGNVPFHGTTDRNPDRRCFGVFRRRCRNPRDQDNNQRPSQTEFYRASGMS